MVTKHNEIYQQSINEYEGIDDSNDSDKQVKFSASYSEQQVKNACLNFVTQQSLPLTFFDSDGFKILTEQIFKGINMNAITSNNIMSLVNEEETKLKRLIRKKLTNKIISLKMDSATRHDRSMFGVNAQIIDKGKVEVFTLSMKEICVPQTAVNLKLEVEEVLREFNIAKKQIYTITTDNGRNMLKAVDMLAETTQEETYAQNDSEETLLNLEEFENDFIAEHRNILSVKCAAHTLQLIVKDFLGKANIISVVEKARQVVKTLRTPKCRQVLQMLNLGKPSLDVPTRWSSTFLMIQKLLKYTEFCNEQLHRPLTDQEWGKLNDLLIILSPIHETTLKLQGEQLVMGECYKAWFELKVKLESLTTELSTTILDCIKAREPNLLNAEVLNAAIFLDPRFRRLLPQNKKEEAKNHLKVLATQLNNLNQAERHPPQVAQASLESNVFIDETSNMSASSLVRQTLRSLEVDSSSEDETPSVGSKFILNSFAEIDTYREGRVDFDANLLEYWEEKKYTFPFLKQLADIVHAAPATEVSVERAFSALRLVLSDLRCNLSQDSLRSLMFVKLNKNVNK
ncbi:uncharacterized protein LOC135958514 [Calliphora vicina]|uniref:uncharacterized protein LOC135958514 n=1 Tax=Calliphora vicina TaxID=7373 RepID=UPI00325C1F53